MPTVRIAHFSVQEYLESERIRHQKAAIFSLSSQTAHAEIAQICIVYLLEPGLSRSILDRKFLEEYPLAYFASNHWGRHYRLIVNPSIELYELLLILFQRQDSFTNWIRLYDVDNSWEPSHVDYSCRSYETPTPVYYPSSLGTDPVLNEMIKTMHVKNTTPAQSLASTFKLSTLVNAQGGKYSYALQAAACRGHEKIIQLLLDRDAGHVNAQGGNYGNALQAALLEGHLKVVQLLVDQGADVNAQGGKYGNALQAASSEGHVEAVRLLIEKGADVNAQGGEHGNALQAASSEGHLEIVKLLLAKGADVNAQGGEHGNALQAASSEGHLEVVQLLLSKGADVNAQGEKYGNSLQAASCQGHLNIVQLLLNQNPDVNAESESRRRCLTQISSV
ncbi:hypothetical protein MMC07_004990 [Pseudocyphellaria aurata]|nr:hypothetical protein [Pseudocyphellaria aurata]